MSDDLNSLTPLDGRYAPETRSLRDYFSEFAYIRDRVIIEINYFIGLSKDAHLTRPLTHAELDFLHSLATSFSLNDAHQIKELEQITRHDVKAIENFLRQKLSSTSLSDLVEFLHFGLTSEDVNNIAQALALRNSRTEVILPELEEILEHLARLVRAYKSTPMLARTHGQPAVPTTFGKELAVLYSRLKKQCKTLGSYAFEAKLTGAVGNLNALAAAASQVDWLAFTAKFLDDLGLESNFTTTQILPYDNWVEYFNTLHLINSILLNLSQDMWRYISDGYVKLQVIASEVGSSTMPQKINPIDFENAEGNLGLANSLLEHFARKLPISRLQRDLSDSTARRTFGTGLGHSVVAYHSLSRGLERVEANPAVMKAELEKHWEVVAEGAQTILRAAGVSGAYEQLKEVSRGKELTQETFAKWIDDLNVNRAVKEKLRGLSPLNYLGLAEKIADSALEEE